MRPRQSSLGFCVEPKNRIRIIWRVMPSHDSAFWAARAEKFRRQAEMATDPYVKRDLTEAAEICDAMVELKRTHEKHNKY